MSTIQNGYIVQRDLLLKRPEAKVWYNLGVYVHKDRTIVVRDHLIAQDRENTRMVGYKTGANFGGGTA